MYLIFKTLITALVVVSVSELAKRHTLLAATIAALPITSILIFTWIYVETKDPQKVSALCEGIAWFILPSVVFFIVLPWLLKKDFGFWSAMGLSLIPMLAAYALMFKIQKWFL